MRFFLALGFLVCIFCFPTGSVAAEMEQAVVLDVSGEAQVLFPAAAHWETLSSGRVLGKGYKIRTGSKSSVEIAFDAKLMSLAKILADSRLDILSETPLHVSLIQGGLLFLREPADAFPKFNGPFAISTRDALTRMDQGGCFVGAGADGTWIKIFGEKAKVFQMAAHEIKSEPQQAEEGFKFFCGKKPTQLLRMNYEDYADWQAWIRKVYERKDDKAAESIEEEVLE